MDANTKYIFERLLVKNFETHPKMPAPLAWAALLVALEVCAEISLERWAKTQKHALLALGVMIYIALAFCFGLALRRSRQLVLLNTAWQSLNIVVVALVGVLVMKEKFTGRRRLGVLFGVMACFLVAS